jgi:hypothetical protein
MGADQENLLGVNIEIMVGDDMIAPFQSMSG